MFFYITFSTLFIYRFSSKYGLCNLNQPTSHRIFLSVTSKNYINNLMVIKIETHNANNVVISLKYTNIFRIKKGKPKEFNSINKIFFILAIRSN